MPGSHDRPYYIQPAGAEGTTGSSPSGSLGLEGQDGDFWVFHGPSGDVAVPEREGMLGAVGFGPVESGL